MDGVELDDALHALGALLEEPTEPELVAAARWTRTHDPSPGFLQELQRVVRLFDVEFTEGSGDVS